MEGETNNKISFSSLITNRRLFCLRIFFSIFAFIQISVWQTSSGNENLVTISSKILLFFPSWASRDERKTENFLSRIFMSSESKTSHDRERIEAVSWWRDVEGASRKNVKLSRDVKVKRALISNNYTKWLLIKSFSLSYPELQHICCEFPRSLQEVKLNQSISIEI